MVSQTCIQFVDLALGMELQDLDTRGRRWKNVFLIEEVIRGDEQGPFRKYLNNVSPVPLPISCGDDDERAKFLSFSQHVQYWKTKKQAFVSDYQGKPYKGLGHVKSNIIIRRELTSD